MENDKKKKITNYTILMNKMLGEGACGKVYVGEQDNTKLKVAVKILEKKTGKYSIIQSTGTTTLNPHYSHKYKYSRLSSRLT